MNVVIETKEDSHEAIVYITNGVTQVKNYPNTTEDQVQEFIKQMLSLGYQVSRIDTTRSNGM